LGGGLVDALVTFLNQPIVLTVLTLAVGGYLFNTLSNRRARRDKVREEAIKFLEEAGSDLNQILSRLFGAIRREELPIPKDTLPFQKSGELYTKRFSVRVKSRAYLNSDTFWRKYETLIFEFREILVFLATHSHSDDREQLTGKIEARRARLAEIWPLKDEPLFDELDPPFQELSWWAQMIWNRAVRLLSSSLEAVLK
jgi:hypothetical protein